MKVSYITTRFPAPSEAFASLDVNTLLELGVQVDVYCIRSRHRDFHRLMQQRHQGRTLGVEHLDLVNFLRSLLYMGRNPAQVFHLVRWVLETCGNAVHVLKSLALLPSAFYVFAALKKRRPDAVHLFWGHYPALVLFLLHRYAPEIRRTLFLGAYSLETRYAGSVEVSRHARAVFTHAHENVDALVDLGVDPDRIRVLHRGTLVDQESVDSVSGKRLGSRPTRFLTASRLVREKGVDEVIGIFARYCERFPGSSLMIAGDGPCEAGLRRLAARLGVADRVGFLGHVSQAELFDRMRGSHCFILMSRFKSETLPNVIKEAMLRRNICITTPSNGIRELIRHGHNGFVFDTTDQVVDFLLDDDIPDLDPIAGNAQATIVQDFNVSQVMKGYLEAWSSP